MFRDNRAFRMGFRRGLAAPLLLYAPTQAYVVPAQAFAPAAAFAAVGAMLTTAVAVHASE